MGLEVGVQYKRQHQNPVFEGGLFENPGVLWCYLIKPRKKGIFLVFWGASYIDVPLILIFTLVQDISVINIRW